MTQEDYKEKYETALSRAKDLLSYKEMRQEDIEWIFSELKESENEILRNRIIGYLKQDIEEHSERKERINEMIAWLEKQGQTFTKKDMNYH
jgi:hypothetical protein